MFEKGMELIKKNEGPEVAHLSDETKDYMNILFDISQHLIASNFFNVRKIIRNSKALDLEKFEDVDKYEFDITAIFSSMRPLPSYGGYIITAYNSLMHENYILYNLMIQNIFIEINYLHRVFFDDVMVISEVLKLMSKKLNRDFTNTVIDWDFELYYKECMENYYPIGDCLRTREDCDYLKKSKYDNGSFDENTLSEELKEYSESGAVKSFVYEIDNYINKGGSSSKSFQMWKILRDALIMNFVLENSAWNKHFSKSLLKSIIGYSKCFNSEDVTNYTMEMKKYIYDVLLTTQTIITVKNGNLFSNDENYLQLVIFLINLYYIFPFEEIMDFAEMITINNSSRSVWKNTYRDIEKQISLIKSGKKRTTINVNTVSSTTQITKVEIVEQSNNPKFTRIMLEVDMIDIHNIDVIFKFYDKNRQQVCNDKPFVLTFEENDSAENHYCYETTILEGDLIQYVEAEIVKKGQKHDDKSKIGNNYIHKSNIHNSSANTQNDIGAYIFWAIVVFIVLLIIISSCN